MKDKRASYLMAILLALLGVFLFKAPVEEYFSNQSVDLPAQSHLLPGNDEIRRVDIVKGDDGYYYADINYFYRGGVASPVIRVLVESPDASAFMYLNADQSAPIKEGENNIRIEVLRPSLPVNEFVSKKIIVKLGDGYLGWTSKKEVDFTIEWVDVNLYTSNRDFSKRTVQDLYNSAVEFIDRADRNTFDLAKKNLERVLIKDPSYIDAYPELARFAMKKSWGPEGLRQAETYLISGLAQQKNHANSHVLLGYVYAHQGKFDQASSEFKIAEQLGTKNLWLWANWGQLYRMQGEPDKAIDMYMKAVSGVRPYNTYDRARLDSYLNLFQLLEVKDNLSKVDELYMRRAVEYSNFPCFHADYAAFKVEKYDDYQAAITESRKAIDSGCETPRSREIMGVANYLAWLKAPESQREAFLSQAQVFFPESPRLLYLLAKNEGTSKIIGGLNKRSSSVDLKDNDNFNALAYALIDNDVSSARRLIGHGAKLTENVGEQNFPVAMAPIFYQHKEGVQLMIELGVDLSVIKYKGFSALVYAEQIQNSEIIELIKRKLKT